MSTYTPVKVSDPRKWTGTYGENEDFTLTLEGVEKPAILTQKPGKAPPAIGEAIELELSPHPRFDDKLKAKRPQQAGAFGGVRAEDPVRSRRILRQHSQQMALRAIDLLHRAAAVDVHALTRDEFWALLRDTTDWFDRDVESVATDASGASSGGSAVPSGRVSQRKDPTPEQLDYLKSLITRAKPDENVLRLMLRGVGADGVDPTKQGWSKALKRDQVSQLIEVFKSGIVPVGGSDIPSDAPEFEVPVDAGDDVFEPETQP